MNGWLFFIGLLMSLFQPYDPQNGDIVFQTSLSAQSKAIQRVTGSPYSHMGIVVLEGGEPFVFEAAGRARLTPLAAWIDRGRGDHVVVKRLRGAERRLTPEGLRAMRAVGKSFEGRPYDLHFEWSDERLYCSELVWKVFQRGLGVEIGTLQSFGEFDLSDPEVAAKADERFGGDLPVDEPVITPAAMFASRELVTVFEQ